MTGSARCGTHRYVCGPAGEKSPRPLRHYERSQDLGMFLTSVTFNDTTLNLSCELCCLVVCSFPGGGWL